MVALAIIIFAVLLYIVIKAVQKQNGPGMPSPNNTFPFESVLPFADNNPSVRGRIGESKVSSVLRSLPPEYLVINDVTIPDQDAALHDNHTTQIDHIVVSPYGIFVIETKNYTGWIFGAEEAKKWKETFKTKRGLFFYNPIKQNWGHTYALAEHLQLRIGVFKPIVVFSDDCQLHIDAKTPVVYISQLKDCIMSYAQELIPRQDIALIYNRICNLNLDGKTVENQHIRSIGDRFIEREATIQQGKCPRCGGALKLRNGKYGAFYGCSNYPKCRFTYNLQSQ